MPTPRGISYIKSNLLRPALTSHFEVEIGLPIGDRFSEFLSSNLRNFGSVQQSQLHLMCSEASLPGSNLATLEINNDFTGVTERHAYRRIYDDRIDLTFYVDAENYLPIRFFETWMKYIVDESIKTQEQRGDVGSEDTDYFYRIRYPADYVASGLKVIKFERDYKQKLEYSFIKSYPISVSSIPVSYDSSSLLKCIVSMTYIRYVLTPTGTPTGQATQNQNSNLTPEQQAALNSSRFFGAEAFTNPNLANINFGNFTTTGGSTFEQTQTSGNSINVREAFTGNFTLNG